ncbi:MAG: flagellar hook protein FlgE [Alphaproteobacteria bacterium]|nr:MAG: flagellar hook protein FlgE [Alphaproteobacteria bacterium]
MTIIGSLIHGVTGVDAQSRSFGAVSDNIANSTTVGYKTQRAEFSTLYTPRQVPVQYAPGGVRAQVTQRVDKEGLVQATESRTDAAVLGRGFFAVAQVEDIIGAGAGAGDRTRVDTDNPGVTRAGSFRPNRDGFLVNTAGYALLGLPVNTPDQNAAVQRTLNGLTPVRVQGIAATIPGQATTEVQLGINLPASGDIGATQDVTVPVYDAQGNTYGATYRFTRVAANTWSGQAVSLDTSGQTVSGTTSGTAQVVPTPVTVRFSSLGEPLEPAGAVSLGSFIAPNGAVLSPRINFGTNTVSGQPKTVQLGDTFGVVQINQNGYREGNRIGLEITPEGYVRETYDNNQIRDIARVPLVTFQNPIGLEARSGNVWLQSTTSGVPLVNTPGNGGAGRIQPSALESSTVDLADEFSTMIITQRAYTASTKIITTADEMYQEVVRLAR